MVQIPVDLRSVRTRCEKHWCKTKEFQLHRHHMGHQYMFVVAFSDRFDEPKYVEFVKRYYSFDKRDVVDVCGPHHREIHLLYDPIIQAAIAHRRKPLYRFTWGEAEDLMQKLVTCCNDWLLKSTKGSKLPWVRHGGARSPTRPETAADWLRQARRRNS